MNPVPSAANIGPKVDIQPKADAQVDAVVLH